LQWLQFWLCRRAAGTIVHNEPLRDLVQRHGGHAIVVTDVPVRFSALEPYPLPDGTNIAVVCSFNPDEPIANVLAAARKLPDVHFHVSGDPSALRAADRSAFPPNARLTGFLSTEAYASLITHADAVLTLTTRDNTMLRGAWEAVYQGTPVIVSDWKVLRESFGSGAVYVDNTPEGIAAGIGELSRNLAHYRAETRSVREQKEHRWDSVKEGLCQLIRR
jgi:glycosyltransferase involved in cell wall biosynthesis